MTQTFYVIFALEKTVRNNLLMAVLLQSFKDFVGNRYVLFGFGAAVGAAALLALLNWRKTRPMSSYPNIWHNRTIMGKLLTPEIFSKIKDKCTSKGYDIDNIIDSGLYTTADKDEMSATERLVENSTGLLAGDEECYDIFSELIDPVISEVHKIDRIKSLRSEVNLNWKKIQGGIFYGANVLSCRLSTSRNIRGYSMIPGCSTAELLDVGHVVEKSLKSIEAKFKRCYLLLPWQYSRLALDGYGFNLDSFPPQLSRDWPKGRFVWLTADRQCRIFVNYFDHIKLYVTQPRGNIQQAFREYSELLTNIEASLKRRGKTFMWSSKYGFLTSSPENIGTGLEVQVNVRLPELIKDPRFEHIVHMLPVKIEHVGESQRNDVICIGNKHKLQFTEVDVGQQVINSVTLLLELDKRIQRGEDIRDLLP